MEKQQPLYQIMAPAGPHQIKKNGLQDWTSVDYGLGQTGS